MNRFHPICRAVEIPHAYDVEVAEKCFAHIPTCVRWRKESHLGWGLSYIHTYPPKFSRGVFLSTVIAEVV